jgi:hypothetical protein
MNERMDANKRYTAKHHLKLSGIGQGRRAS